MALELDRGCDSRRRLRDGLVRRKAEREAGAAADVEHVERRRARDAGNQAAPGARLRVGEETVVRFQIEVGGPPVASVYSASVNGAL